MVDQCDDLCGSAFTGLISPTICVMTPRNFSGENTRTDSLKERQGFALRTRD